MKDVFFRLLLITAAVVIAVLCFEVVVRILGLAQQTANFYQPDLSIGVKHVPGAQGWWRKKDFKTFVTFNAEGFRDDDHAEKKSPGVFRIVVLGDSYVEALQVPFEQTFMKLLEQRLNDNSDGKRFEILNFGTSGFGIAQDYLALKHYGYKYDPDLVILAVTTGNDVRNGHPDLELDSTKPYFMKTQSGVDIRPFTVPKQSIVSDIINRHFFSHARVYLSQTAGPLLWQMKTRKKAAVRSAISLDLYVYSDPYSSVWKEAWDLSLGGIALMRKELSAQGKALVVVTLTDNDAQIDGTLQGNLERMNTDPTLRWDGEKPVKVLSEFCHRENIAFLPLLNVFRDEYRKTPEKYHFVHDGHWNRRGHAIAAHGIFNKLVAEGMIGNAVRRAQ